MLKVTLVKGQQEVTVELPTMNFAELRRWKMNSEYRAWKIHSSWETNTTPVGFFDSIN
jgi:hypothetical protein